MQVEELKGKIATLSVAELAEVEAFVQELMNDRVITSKRGLSFEAAADHVRSNYAHLLHKLSQ